MRSIVLLADAPGCRLPGLVRSEGMTFRDLVSDSATARFWRHLTLVPLVPGHRSQRGLLMTSETFWP